MLIMLPLWNTYKFYIKVCPTPINPASGTLIGRNDIIQWSKWNISQMWINNFKIFSFITFSSIWITSSSRNASKLAALTSEVEYIFIIVSFHAPD